MRLLLCLGLISIPLLAEVPDRVLADSPETFRCDTFRRPPDFVVGVEKTMTHTLSIRRGIGGAAVIKRLPNTLPALRGRVRQLVDERRATHVILFAAGWHMQQADAVSGAGWMLDSLAAEAKRTGVAFRPVTIALTWPAGARGGVFPMCDYSKRSAIADEIGAIWGSRVLENVVAPAAGNVRTVLLGHSLGARLLTSAIAARATLPERMREGRKVDWVIGLQAAFPRGRLLPGGEYAGILREASHVLFTSSANDLAVSKPGALLNLPFGIGRLSFSEHYMGSYMTSADISKYPELSEAFAPMWVMRGQRPAFPQVREKVIVADCSDIIASHNDVWGNPQLARLIMSAISIP